MATTYTETNETRLYFTFARDGETKTRYIALPGVPDAEGDRRATVISNFSTFRTQVMDNGDSTSGEIENFIQPADWRDASGSSDISANDQPWTTTNVELEFYVVQRTRFDGQA